MIFWKNYGSYIKIYGSNECVKVAIRSLRGDRGAIHPRENRISPPLLPQPMKINQIPIDFLNADKFFFFFSFLLILLLYFIMCFFSRFSTKNPFLPSCPKHVEHRTPMKVEQKESLSYIIPTIIFSLMDVILTEDQIHS